MASQGRCLVEAGLSQRGNLGRRTVDVIGCRSGMVRVDDGTGRASSPAQVTHNDDWVAVGWRSRHSRANAHGRRAQHARAATGAWLARLVGGSIARPSRARTTASMTLVCFIGDAQLAVAPEPAHRRLSDQSDSRRAGPVNLIVKRLLETMASLNAAVARRRDVGCSVAAPSRPHGPAQSTHDSAGDGRLRRRARPAVAAIDA
jgi:hypothetical protein